MSSCSQHSCTDPKQIKAAKMLSVHIISTHSDKGKPLRFDVGANLYGT